MANIFSLLFSSTQINWYKLFFDWNKKANFLYNPQYVSYIHIVTRQKNVKQFTVSFKIIHKVYMSNFQVRVTVNWLKLCT